jgi:hypothetical protein
MTYGYIDPFVDAPLIEEAHAVCPRCGHGVERFPCWQCGYPGRAWFLKFIAAAFALTCLVAVLVSVIVFGNWLACRVAQAVFEWGAGP